MMLSELTAPQKEALLCLAHDVVVSDGDLTATEQAMMQQMRVEMGLSPEFEARYVEVRGIEKTFQSRRARAITLISLIRLAYADGAFEIEEECFLRDLAEKFQVPAERFGLMDNWVRRLIALEKEVTQLL